MEENKEIQEESVEQTAEETVTEETQEEPQGPVTMTLARRVELYRQTIFNQVATSIGTMPKEELEKIDQKAIEIGVNTAAHVIPNITETYGSQVLPTDHEKVLIGLKDAETNQPSKLRLVTFDAEKNAYISMENPDTTQWALEEVVYWKPIDNCWHIYCYLQTLKDLEEANKKAEGCCCKKDGECTCEGESACGCNCGNEQCESEK